MERHECHSPQLLWLDKVSVTSCCSACQLLLVSCCLRMPAWCQIPISILAEQNSLLTPFTPLFCSCRFTTSVCRNTLPCVRVKKSCGTSRRRMSQDWSVTLVESNVALYDCTAEFIPVPAMPPISVQQFLKAVFLDVCRCGTAYMCSSDC